MNTKSKSQKSKSQKSKAKSAHKPKRQPKSDAKKHTPKAVLPADPDCPYRPKTLYSTLFTEGRQFILKPDLITKVAQRTGKSEKVVGFAYQVLKAKHHRSNSGRSTLLVDDSSGKVKFVALGKVSVG